MRSRSGDPAYWRQKAAEFRRRALGTADDSRVVLLRRALEFDRIAEELDELIGGDRPQPLVAVAPRAVPAGRARLAFAGVATAFAIGCAVGAAGPALWPTDILAPRMDGDRLADAATPAPLPPQDARALAEAAPAVTAPADEPQQARTDAPAPPAAAPQMVVADERSAKPADTASANALPAGTLPATAAAEPPAEPSAPTAEPEIVAARTPAAAPAVADPPAPAPPERDDGASADPPTPAPPTPDASHARAAGHEASVPRRSAPREVASERPAARPRVARAKPDSLQMRRELPPPAPTLSATSAPVAAPTPVVAHAADLVGGAAARVAETEGSPQECRPYTSARTAVGLNRPVRGLACRRPDGRWQLVTEMPDN